MNLTATQPDTETPETVQCSDLNIFAVSPHKLRLEDIVHQINAEAL